MNNEILPFERFKTGGEYGIFSEISCEHDNLNTEWLILKKPNNHYSGYEKMRAPFQVLVIPFRHTAFGPEFAVLKRSDADYWQFVAGGGEDDETPEQAARRETEEESGLLGTIIPLDSLSTVPKSSFADADLWGPDIFVIPQHCFAIDTNGHEIVLSREHTECRWVPFEEALRLLKWDSNRNALWELNERLKTLNNSQYPDSSSIPKKK